MEDIAKAITAPEAAAGLLDMPAVNARAAGAEAPAAAPKPSTPPAADGVDSLGRKFDPSKFRPEKDVIGRWKNLRGGRKRKGVADTQPPAAAQPSENVV